MPAWFLSLFALAALASAWLAGPVGPVVIVVLSVGIFVFFLFQVPLVCGAEIRGTGTCRNNAYGLLRGCNQVRQHKWQKVKTVFSSRRRWQALTAGMWTGPDRRLSCVATVGGAVSALAAVVTLALGR